MSFRTKESHESNPGKTSQLSESSAAEAKNPLEETARAPAFFQKEKLAASVCFRY